MNAPLNVDGSGLPNPAAPAINFPHARLLQGFSETVTSSCCEALPYAVLANVKRKFSPKPFDSDGADRGLGCTEFSE